jgi:hypothetical protein
LKFKKRGLQYSEIIFDFIKKEIRFNRANSGGLSTYQLFRQTQSAPLIIEDGFIDLNLIVDNCSAELFSGGGQIVMSNQIFPDSTSNKIELTALNEDIIFEEFNIWKLEKSAPSPDPNPGNYQLFRVYPNPVVNNNGITIKIKDEMVGMVKFKLYNGSGMLISEFQPASNSMIIPKNKIGTSKGIYFLTGSDGKTTQTEKLLVLVN